MLIITPRILVRCHIGDPVTIQCVDAQSGLRLFFNLELTVCPKRCAFFEERDDFQSFFRIECKFLQRTFKLVAIHELKHNVGVTLELGKFIHERKQSYERIANFG